MLSLQPRRGVLALELCALTISTAGTAADMPKLELNGSVEGGKTIAMDRSKGNCIACHMIPGGESPGAIGPALVAMQTRYPTKEALAVQIWDATVKSDFPALLEVCPRQLA